MVSLRSLRRTAVHEAGHAVVAISEGCAFEFTAIEQVDDRHGCVKGMRHRRGDDELVRIMLGGIVAHRLTRKIWHPSVFSHANDDLDAVAAFAEEAHMQDTLVVWNVDATVKTLTARWAQVDAVADALLGAKRLTYQQVLTVASAVPPGIKRNPPGRVPEGGWKRLVDDVQIRRKHPGGLRERLAAIKAELLANGA